MKRLRSIIAPVLAFAAMWLPAPALAAAPCTLGTAGETVSVAIGDSGRSTLLHIPAGYDGSEKLPLVFVLHGSGGAGTDGVEGSGLDATADAHGFILASPDGGIPVDGGFVWNIPGVPTVTGAIPTADDADDVAFLLGAIDWLAAQGCADPHRVYATGVSGGGRMTSWLGCVAAEHFAAIAPVVGLRAGNPLAEDPQRPDPATCQPGVSLPVMAFAGDADTVNPVQGGGTGYWQYTMDAALARWAELDGCTAGPVTRELSDKEYQLVYSDCDGGAEVAGWIFRGRGHEWVPDNDAMWAFFERFRR